MRGVSSDVIMVVTMFVLRNIDAREALAFR